MATMQDLRPEEVANLKGKTHPLYKGVLRLAGENGLRDLTVRVIQAPLPENGNLAICEATAVFGRGDEERRFTEIGDADNANCGGMIAPHKVRMAATRAKGRALRDALGIGEALVEEIGSEPREAPSATERCSVCGEVLSPRDLEGCQKHPEWFDGKLFCRDHAKEFRLMNERVRVPSGTVG